MARKSAGGDICRRQNRKHRHRRRDARTLWTFQRLEDVHNTPTNNALPRKKMPHYRGQVSVLTPALLDS